MPRPGATHTSVRSALAVAAVSGLFLTACGGVDTNTGSGGGDSATYPSGTVQMYVGASAGGSSDLISRATSKGLSDSLKASFPVINKPGANGALAAAEVAKAKPDGSVISVQNASLFAITPLAVPESEVTKLDDFEVVHGISRDDYVLVTSAKSGFKTVDDIKAAKKRVTFGTTGVGTGAQLSCLLLFSTSGVDAKAVPFDGGAPALTALLGNQVDTACLQIGEAIENVEAGKLTPLTVFGPERVEFLPDTPTAKESGLDVEVAQYRFLTVPKGTPQNVKDALTKGLKETFATAAYKDFNKANSLTPMEVDGPEVAKQLEADQKRYADLVAKYKLNLGGE
jgi:tripartite-type tricarboxylate transporter receptor subunit TctC